MPAAGFVAGRLLAARPAVLVTMAAAAGYALFCVATFVQALADQPFLPMLG